MTAVALFNARVWSEPRNLWLWNLAPRNQKHMLYHKVWKVFQYCLAVGHQYDRQ